MYNHTGSKLEYDRKNIRKGYNKKNAKEICKLLEGLSFSCRIVLIKKTLFSLYGRRYLIKTDAPTRITNELVKGVYC